MEPSSAVQKVRISEIAGRYLVFDIKQIAHLRRNHNICSILVGITPQAPNQSVFSGLPLELAPEEARLLVDNGAAYVEDDAAAHLSRLTELDPSSRKAYVETLRRQRQSLQALEDNEAVEREKRSAQARAKRAGKLRVKRRTGSGKALPQASSELAGTESANEASLLFDDRSPEEGTQPTAKVASPTTGNTAVSRSGVQPRLKFTPTTSAGLLYPTEENAAERILPRRSPLLAHLNARGYFITPGLRFGGDYSVYPGDPFRFHAHFMATGYGWDEPINLLDLVGGGRLATGVKKGFLIGAEENQRQPQHQTEEAEEDEAGAEDGGRNVRTFTLEWAAM